jgi:hypothetical protein
MASAYRPEFIAALKLFARVSEAMKARGFQAPVLVGGAAVEYYTASSIMTGDFDIVTGRQDAFEEELQRVGFIRPSGAGKVTRGWLHPDLALGFEVVADVLLDGYAERDRVRLVQLDDAGIAAFVSVEDMIADRMGQYASGSAREMRAQAKALFDLFPDADMDYMEMRIRHETVGDFGVQDLAD